MVVLFCVSATLLETLRFICCTAVSQRIGHVLPCNLLSKLQYCTRGHGGLVETFDVTHVVGLLWLQADRVFLSPPWGGPAYSTSGMFDVTQNIGNLGQNLRQLLQTAASALKDPNSQDVACFLPRNTDLHALSDTALGQRCLVERNVLNSHLKSVTVYYGSMAVASS